jgi:hypothetical protein
MPIRANTISNFYAGNHLISLWAYSALSQIPQGMEWIKKQQTNFPDNKIIQWALGSYKQKKIQPISIQSEDATIRIIKQLSLIKYMPSLVLRVETDTRPSCLITFRYISFRGLPSAFSTLYS